MGQWSGSPDAPSGAFCPASQCSMITALTSCLMLKVQ